MKKLVKKAVEAELNYIDNMNYGDVDTTARIMLRLGYDNLSFDDLMDIDFAVYDEIKRNREYMMDKSSHEGKVEGLPFNLDFVKVKKL